jgi:hypothetical protein
LNWESRVREAESTKHEDKRQQIGGFIESTIMIRGVFRHIKSQFVLTVKEMVGVG